MEMVTRSDLVYAYSWTALRGDDPRLTGRPDDVLLNRGEGYEVLAFINSFCTRHNFAFPVTKRDALKVERLIHDHLPGSVRSRKNVDAWLVDNWKMFA